MKNRILYLMTFLMLITLLSCNKSFLDVSEELAEEQTLEKIFSNPDEARKWHRGIYTGIPNTVNFYWTNRVNGWGNPWTNMCDELVPSGRENYPYTRTLDPTDNNKFGRWQLYKLIRRANMFLEHAKETPYTEKGEPMKAVEVEDLKAQARFFRAYYHYLLFELYGPIPIMDKSVEPSSEDLDFARNSVDEVVDFIYNELTETSNLLQNPSDVERTLAVPTKGVALAVRARLMMYAASPLFNGGYQEALSLTNKDGKHLFPAKDQSKWNKALDAVQEFIDYAANHYELHKVYESGVLDPDKSIYEVHMKYNKEIIFARSDDEGVISSGVGHLDHYIIPRGALGGTTNTGVTGVLQELVDDFFMNDGLSIKDSPLYNEVGFSLAGDDVTGRTKLGDHRMFINREPRFYNTVFYNGRNWHIGLEQIWFNKGGNSDNFGASPYSGHLIYKRMSQEVYRQAPHPNTVYRPIVVFRLAEFYLLYAEALNEVNHGDPRIIEYVDKVRERAGIPLYRKLHDDDIKTGVIGNQEAQREAIRAEMRVELATEGQRYFDVNRWMISAKNVPGEGGLAGPFHGMDMNAPTLEGFYKRTVIQNRVFDKKEYLFPLPNNEIANSNLLVQNPDY